MAIPAGWERDPNNPDVYKARDKVGGRYIEYELNVRTGDYTGDEYRAPDGSTRQTIKNWKSVDLFSYNADDDTITYQNNSFKEELQSNTGKLSVIKNTLAQRAYEINKTLSQTEGSGITSQDREQFLEGPRYKTIEETLADDEEVNVSDIVGSLADQISPKNITKGFGRLYYPSTLSKNTQKQDIIKFTVGTYKGKKLTLNEKSNLGILSGKSSFNNDSSVFSGKPTEIFLPIQPSITDSNTVDWNENRLDPIQAGLLQAGVTVMNKGGSGVKKTLEGYEETFKKNPELINVGKLLLAQEAVGAQNVLSRFGGGILNPNLELLFNGPQLRPFNFSFRLSPRNDGEATQVRTIIRAFKQSMAVKKTTGLFLATPNIFKIEYLRKNEQNGYGDHPSLNRIKTCALKSCVVDYTPENSYATYNDPSNTMVSYNMTLQFQELEPVTDADYNKTSFLDEIGY